MDKITNFQLMLLKDENARREFAAAPAEFLRKNGIDVPAGTKLPDSVPVKDLEAATAQIDAQLKQRGVDVHASGAKLDQIQAALDDMKRATSAKAGTSSLITVSGIVAVCAVVTVPAVVAGIEA